MDSAAGRQKTEAPASAQTGSTQPASAVQAEAVPAAPAAQGRAIKSSPLARKMAAEQGIDLRSVQGSGPGGRIVKRDIEKLQLRPEAGAPPAVAQPAIPVSAAVITPESAADERIPVSGKRKIIAQRLAESKFSAPHFYLRLEVDAGSMMKARERLNARLVNDPAGKVSPNAFLIKFAAEALRRHPLVNSSWQGDSILRHGSIDIGLAVAQEDGLITPVVRNCAGKGILAIDRELKELVDKARNNRLTPEQYSGATFTISSLGTYGITEFTAIINPPGSAILAVGSIRKVPVVGQNDEVNIQSQMVLTLSCDHRVIDGATGAAFLAELKRYVENPVEVLY